MNHLELAFGISALAFGVGLLVMHLPIPWLRRHGWASMMHSLTGIIIIIGLGTLSLVKAFIAPYVEPYIGVPLTATFDDAMSRLEMFREMVYNHIMAVNKSAIALGAAMAVILIASSLAMIVGVGILVSMIANYIVSAVFGLFLFIQKALSAIFLFVDIVEILVTFAQLAAPGLFIIGVILYVTPFARTLGKTLMVLGAGFALALPPVIVAALPSPDSMQDQIEKSEMVQAYSIALDGIREMQGGVRINFYDRNGTILTKSGGLVKHESRPILYPYFRLRMKDVNSTPPIDCDNLPPGVSCEDVIKAAEEMLKTPESGFVNSGDYYNSRENGYRLTLTLPEDANGSRSAEFYPELWVMGMWLHLQGEDRGKNTAVKIEGAPIPDDKTYNEEELKEQEEVYEQFKEENEEFWNNAPYEKIYAYNAIQEGYNTSFIWFTQTPPGSSNPLNKFKVKPVVTGATCIAEPVGKKGNETIYEYKLRVSVDEETVTYFAYLEGTNYSVSGDSPTGGVKVVDASLQDLVEAGVIKGGGSLTLEPAVDTAEEAPTLHANPPTRYKEVRMKAGSFIVSKGSTCEEAYLKLLEKIEAPSCFNEEESKVRNYIRETDNESGNYTGPEIIKEPNELNKTSVGVKLPSCGKGRLPVSVVVYFSVDDETGPYVPQVDWEPFDQDEQFLEEAASGAYVPDEWAEDTHREEWDDYPIFRLSLYRDAPVQYGSRLVVQKLDEFKDETWANSTFGAVIYNTVREAYLKSAGQYVAIPVAGFLLGESGGVGILDAVVMVVGCTVSLALALTIFMVCLDAVAGLVGGRSASKTLFTRIAGALSIGFASQFLASMRGIGFKQPSVAAQAQSWSRMNQMYREAIQSRRMRLDRWRNLLQMRRAELFLRTARDTRSPTRFTLALARERMRAAKDAVFERMLNLRERLDQHALTRYTLRPLVDVAVMRYATGVHKYGVLRDAEYAKQFKETALFLKQSRPVKTSLRDLGEGAAKMMREASLGQRIALADHLARHPEFGRAVALKGLLEGLDAKVKAPAAFKVAAESMKPRTDIFGGIRPNIPYAFIPTPHIGLRTKDAAEVNIPYLHTTSNPIEGYNEVNEAVKSYEDLVRPLGEEGKHLKETLAGEHLKPPEVYEKPEWLDKVVEVEAYFDNRHEPAVFEVEPHNVDSLLNTLDQIGAEVTSASVRKDLSWEDTHEAGLSQMKFHDYGPYLSDDLKQAFDWIAGDAIDRAPHKGYNVGDVLSSFEREASQPNPSPEVKDVKEKDEYRGWWNE